MVIFFVYFCNSKTYFVDYIKKIQASIADDLQLFNEQFRQTMQHDNPLLQTALSHILQRTGKLMRPTLVFLSARMVGKVNQDVVNAAISLELLHTASLVHDDVVDESDRRRGQASVNALLDNQAAVLVGDFLLSKAIQHAAFTQNTQFLSYVGQLGQSLADGELLQLDVTSYDKIEEASYYEIIRKKTASLFAVCAQAGALLAGGSSDDVERMRQIGQLIGVSFQLRDDLFDYDASVDVGKPTGNDMKEGKLTLPVIHALLKASDDEMLLLARKVRSGEASIEEINRLVRFAKENDGIEYAHWAIDEFRMMARGLVEENKDPAITESLLEYIDYACNRMF